MSKRDEDILCPECGFKLPCKLCRPTMMKAEEAERRFAEILTDAATKFEALARESSERGWSRHRVGELHGQAFAWASNFRKRAAEIQTIIPAKSEVRP